ncbi:Ca-activated chloride channel family protein [Leeuwenhoekiella aestuarii]|uniref:Ca-activated chloride channel family protein n=1 Tax=Leeuwenhoekiella aestuarii TaxID=2249426 RepID=A0A4Q0NYR3_9FLAO|nr:VWA domain-containing protein [Leeuwenhoekiella aestuarii]RXG18083.1 Ca-activated chloride channel family protein [Leeuwenhoekiella aestuarii]RXG19389.1 Ca-activated chloride channel family protein [Leeuwenhoekiella aestuarii]
MYLLEEKIWFWALLAIPVVVLLYFAVTLWKRTAQKRFVVNRELLEKLTPQRSVFKPVLKLIVFCLALACMTVALVNPKIGTKLETVKREGVDVVFAVDVSKSMDAEDIAPSRIDKAKQLVTQIINNLGSDRVGIIAYAGSAYPQLPITTDYSSAKMFLNSMNTDMLSSQGTAIKDAIELAKTYYNDEEQTNRVLVIISDGEDHEGDAASIAESAQEQGIRIFTVGVGSEAGDRIPIKRNGVVQSYKKDQNGETVITKLDAETLKQIAAEANGEYIDGNSTQKVVDKMKTALSQMDKKEFEAKQFADFKDQFQWFVAAALFLLFIDVFLLERKTAWVRKLNLFNENKTKS